MRRAWMAWSVIVGACALASVDGCGDDSIFAPSDASATDATSAIGDATTSLSDTSIDAGVNAPIAMSCLVDAGPLSDAAVQLGISLVKQYKCQTCHGEILSGNDNGVPSPTGTAYPPNLTPDETTGLGCWSDALIVRAMLDGFDDQDAALCPPMPKFRDAGLDETSAEAIVTFLRSLTPISNQVMETQCGAGDAGDLDSATDAADGGDGSDGT